MSDSGSWDLRCSQCGHVFELELDGAGSIVEASRTFQCPACLQIPSTEPAQDTKMPHQVVGFHIEKKPHARHGL
ncbi:MAG TPA: hypothetical protein VGH50_07020 [Candidatus Binatia bacterium]|jgi:hypothetical protein